MRAISSVHLRERFIGEQKEGAANASLDGHKGANTGDLRIYQQQLQLATTTAKFEESPGVDDTSFEQLPDMPVADARDANTFYR